jgi:hypothetical protein
VSRARAIVAGCLLVVGVVLVPFANAAVWGHRQLLDTPRFVDLASDVVRTPGVQTALAERITDQLVARSRALALARPVVQGATERVIDTSAFLTVFEPAVASLHRQLLDGDDQLTLDLRAVVPLIRQQLGRIDSRLGALVPDVGLVSVVVADRADAPALWDGVDVAQRGWWILPLVAVVLLAAAIAVANRRSTMTMLVGFGVAGVALVMVGVLSVARDSLDGATGAADRRLVRAVWDVVVRSLREQTLVLVGIGLVLAVVAGAVRLAVTRPSAARPDPARPGPAPVREVAP